ncbi:chitinase [Nakamurella sp. GG22]
MSDDRIVVDDEPAVEPAPDAAAETAAGEPQVSDAPAAEAGDALPPDTDVTPPPPAGPPPVEATPMPAMSGPAGSGRHLSWFRVFLVFAVVAGGISGWWWFNRHQESVAGAPVPDAWFAPYVDVTSTPTYPFESPTTGQPTSAVLAFVVSAQDKPCEPSWGGAYTMAAAGGEQLDLDRRVARLRQLGGEVTVSFGGAANSELSIGCTDVKDLTTAYQSVIDRYSATEIDLDIEGSAASDSAVNKRRAEAMLAISTKATAAGKPVAIWLTLPVGEQGLVAEGLAVLNSMVAAKVPLAGVNAMTMDYGVPLPAGRSMADQGELALTALMGQLQDVYKAAGTDLSDAQAWQMIGATPMIGQNDIPDEVFGLDDAKQLVSFAQQVKLARLSMWSANRDQSCGPNYPDVKVVSDACSGIDQSVGEFTSILRTFGGDAPAAATSTAVTATGSASASATATASSGATTTTGAIDDPAKSPYQIWNPNVGYPKGSKVVWHKNVYQSKYYSVGDQPDTPVASADLTPWTLIGPVLPGDTPAPTPTLPAGTYPDWSPKEIYVAGSRVLLDGIGWQAKYWTQGDKPGTIPLTPDDDSPWQLIQSPK